MGDNPTARLFAELLQALHDESDALIANDAARLTDAGNRRDHVLRLLAPQANALPARPRSWRRSTAGTCSTGLGPLAQRPSTRA
jgi:hypothetical protein